jgi:FAD/FMN-containing dehydrogenase
MSARITGVKAAGGPASPLGIAGVAEFRKALTGEVILPGDSGYDKARAVWNGMIDRYPAVVVRPTGSDDVRAALRLAREHELVVAVRSGGHSIPGLSTCDGGIVIDLSRMRGVRVNPERRTARVAGGAHLAELDDAAQAFGLVCPVGVVAHTGVAGLTLGGGMGRIQRKFGLTIDSLLSVDVVTADGRLVHASEDENPDLFWGLRGAGPNFGIATSFEFRLHEFGTMVTHGWVVHPIERVHDLAAAFREVVEIGVDELMVTIGVGLALPARDYPDDVAGRPIVWLVVMHCGSEDDADRDLARVRAVGPPVVDTIVRKPYLAAQHTADEEMQWGHRFYMKSGFMSSFPDEAVDVCVDHVQRAPEDGGCSIGAWAWGRAIADVPEAATAFTGREANYWIAAETVWDDPSLDEAHRAWTRTAMADLDPYMMTARYVNDVVESGEDVVRSVYGAAKYQRLVALKRTWDPDNVFRLNQNVRP